MEGEEKHCLDQHHNVSFPGLFCEAAWDSFLCWPPLSAGEVLTRPCPQMNARGRIIGEATHPDMYAIRICDELGQWLENKTNFSLCVANMATLYPSPWMPTIVALIVVIGSILSVTLYPSPWMPTIVALIVVIGSILSVISLSMSLFIFCYFNCLKCSRLKVHKNLSIALLLNLLLLIVSSSPVLLDVSYRHKDWLCKTVLSLQMYSGMASINWMFVEGLLLHSRVTVHIFKRDAPFKLYYCIGWGLPGVCISSWSVLMLQNYKIPCWTGYGNLPYIWVVTGPMMAALMVNTIFLIDIIRVLLAKRHTHFVETLPSPRLEENQTNFNCPWRLYTANTSGRRKALKATALLFPLLGIPHLIFCINPKDNGDLEEAYMIINAFIKSSQGLFVSVLYCFLNNDVQTVLRKAYIRSLVRRNPDYCHKLGCRGRGLSQTSGMYMTSHSLDGDIPGRMTLRFQKISTKPKTNCMTDSF